MAGNTPALAVEAFLEPLRRSLSCVTKAVLQVTGYYPREEPHIVFLGEAEPVDLRGEGRLRLAVNQWFRIVESEGPRGPWKVRTAGYSYEVEDGDRNELLAFHWHPHVPRTSEPHLHVRAATHEALPQLGNAHLPTGRVSIEEVIRLLLDELNVEAERDDWESVLDRSQTDYEAWRTWP